MSKGADQHRKLPPLFPGRAIDLGRTDSIDINYLEIEVFCLRWPTVRDAK